MLSSYRLHSSWGGSRALCRALVMSGVGALLLPACQGTPTDLAPGPDEPPALAAPRELPPGIVIDMGTEDATSHAVVGFSLPESTGTRSATWSEGELSTLAFHLKGGAPGYVVAFLAEPYHPLGEVPVGVAFNKHPLGNATVVRGWRAYRVVVPGSEVNTGRNELSFHFAKTGRPSDFDPGSSDLRELGVRFDEVQVQPITSEVALSFGSRNALALSSLGEGWERDPSDRGTGTWTVAERATLTFSIAKADVQSYRLELSARAPRGVAERTVNVSLNGSPLGPLVFPESKSSAAIDVPAARLKAENELAFEFQKLETPAELDPSSKDKRHLGLRVFGLAVQPTQAESPSAAPAAALDPR